MASSPTTRPASAPGRGRRRRLADRRRGLLRNPLTKDGVSRPPRVRTFAVTHEPSATLRVGTRCAGADDARLIATVQARRAVRKARSDLRTNAADDSNVPAT